MSKDNEIIMCLDKGRMFLGGAPLAKELERATTCPGIAIMARRGDVETNKDLVQPIPYAAIIAPAGPDSDEAKVLVYKRSAAGGEKRLQDKWSIGIGGHINASDVDYYYTQYSTEGVDSPAYACLVRELFEELGMDELKCDAVLMSNDVIYDDSEDVSSVHIGLHYIFILESIPELNVEDALTSVEWVSLNDIAQGTEIYNKLEGWSKIIADRLLKTLAIGAAESA